MPVTGGARGYEIRRGLLLVISKTTGAAFLPLGDF